MKFLYVSILFCTAALGCTSSSHIERVDRNVISPNRININAASATELEELPGIGEILAARIVEFRALNGPFQRAEHLMLVDGMSEAKFKDIRALVRVE